MSVIELHPEELLDQACAADDHGRAVVHRVVEPAPCRDQAVELGDRDAHVALQRPREPTGGHRAVQVERPACVRAVEIEAVRRGQDDRVSLLARPDGDAQVGDERLTEEGVQALAVGDGAVLPATDSGAWGG